MLGPLGSGTDATHQPSPALRLLGCWWSQVERQVVRLMLLLWEREVDTLTPLQTKPPWLCSNGCLLKGHYSDPYCRTLFACFYKQHFSGRVCAKGHFLCFKRILFFNFSVKIILTFHWMNEGCGLDIFNLFIVQTLSITTFQYTTTESIFGFHWNSLNPLKKDWTSDLR